MTNNENKKNNPDILSNTEANNIFNNDNNFLNEEKIDIDTLSTILTDAELRTDELKKLDAQKDILKNLSKQEIKSDAIIFDINIQNIDDLLLILLKNQYDFLAIEPNNDYVKVSFKKDSILKEIKYIKYHIYYNLLLQAKKICLLKTEETKIEQKGIGNYQFLNKNLDILSKTVPGNFGETLFLKTRTSEKKVEKKSVVKKKISASQAFGFLGAIFFICLILGGAFITFVIFNAQTPEDVSFFQNLGINLNDINSFLLTLTTIVFAIVVLVQTIVLIIFLFKALLTKKEFKRKKTIFTILSILFLIITFATGTLWIALDKKIKSLPNWYEMSKGDIQIFDNSLLNTKGFNKESSLIDDFSSLIGPVELKFDVNYLKKSEERRGFKINKYIWNFGDGTQKETQTPEIIHSFKDKGNYKTSLTIKGIDSRNPKINSKDVAKMPEISISYIVKITEKILNNGGKTLSFDANELKPLGKIEWYLKEDLTKPVFDKYVFSPSKVYFEEDFIGMRIVNDSSSKILEKIFSINGETSQIKGEINYEIDLDNDLNYTFSVKNIENKFGDGFIKSFTWIIDGKQIEKEADVTDTEKSSEFNYIFQDYGSYNIKLIITNTAGKSVTIEKKITTVKKIIFDNKIDVYENDKKIENVEYNNKNGGEYFLFLETPTTLRFDARFIRSNNVFTINDIDWDIGSDGTIEHSGKTFEKSFDVQGVNEVTVIYKLKHKKNKDLIEEKKEIINVEFTEKEVMLNLEMKPESEYAPALVVFDASLSKIKDDDIIKFIYDYGDGIKEERDAKNSGHKYLKEGNYKVTLTVITKKGKEYSIVKDLIFKPNESKVSISVSMKKTKVNQEIDFLSTDSSGQIVGYLWVFGDGETSNEPNPSHAYKTPGKYKVKLTLEFANNNIDSEDIDIEIIE